MDSSFLVALLFFIMFSSKSTSMHDIATNVIFHATVAQDGSGNYKTINDAILAAPVGSTTRYYIYVKPGIYSEYVMVGANKTNIALIGANSATTKITGNRSNATGYETIQTATLSVAGMGFIAQSLTIENSSPRSNRQAVALYNNADHSVFYKCVFLGYQDTLYADGPNSQFYKNCDIYGAVDFICGYARAVFQDCRIYAHLVSNNNVITAQEKYDLTLASGFAFQNCNITIDPKLGPHKSEVRLFLGRDWRDYGTVVFMESYLDDIVPPEGWELWCNNCTTTKMYFAEYNNRGPGANTSGRVKWPGYHILKNAIDVERFTVSKLIDGDSWLPKTGVPYRGGLN